MIYLVGGARPNFMKIAAISRAFEKYHIKYEIVHTGQHYDYNMDKVFFENFNLKEPIVHLEVGSGSHGVQTARIIERFEEFCLNNSPDLVFLVGDVNSTLGAAIAVCKLNIPIAHQEAGMRSYDRTMPEEVNRVVVDHLSDLLFPISEQDEKNLLKEGISTDKTFLVGDVMIDNLLFYIDRVPIREMKEDYILCEIHRPANTDKKETLETILSALKSLSKDIKVIFVLHPRTSKMIHKFNLENYLESFETMSSVGYFDFLSLMKGSKLVVTDSDGIQQETSVLGIPCVSIRDTCNIAYTLEYGTNVLVDVVEEEKIYETVKNHLESRRHNTFPENLKRLNDGNASERIARVLLKNNII
ncbi:MAG: UDP-N-acetylglucosamine 2-epimerase (non-hydrolyzing) [Tenericutes bacterium]|nr:MAG: UDP-N-acetylglucosamine 2-epimerase (non-hydrolyzing) [Mycoplasmatota bacterium]